MRDPKGHGDRQARKRMTVQVLNGFKTKNACALSRNYSDFLPMSKNTTDIKEGEKFRKHFWWENFSEGVLRSKK
jgi:hypothetical protein